MSEPSSAGRDRIEKLADSFMASYRAGQRPSIDAYVEQYPDLAHELRGLIAALIVLERNAPRLQRTPLLPDCARAGANTPREIGEFAILREIGRGGMGIVYEAVQQSLGRHVALKVLSLPGTLHPTHLERFRIEARSAARLHHSHIVPVFGVGEHEGVHYYAMQFIPGQSLDQVIKVLRRLRGAPADELDDAPATDPLAGSLAVGLLSGRLTAPTSPEIRPATPSLSPGSAAGASAGNASFDAEDSAPATESDALGEFTAESSGQAFYDGVARVGLQVAEALAYAHSEGILHRDIKPSNLLLDAKGNAWITDFGLVKAEDSQSLTETGDFVGTLRYTAPERLDGWSDRRSDIYSLGVTLYELLTLHKLFASASRAQLIECIREKQPVAPRRLDPAVPRDLETIVLKAINKEPGARYHTADELAEDLRRVLADQPILARRATARDRLVRWCRHNPLVASLAATVALTVIAGSVASTTMAIRATRAERLAESRLAAANEARGAEAEQRREAERNYRTAMEAVDQFFTSISEFRLANEPGLQPLRQELLQLALKYYQDFAKQPSADPSVRRNLGQAYYRLGSINNDLGHMREATAYCRRALEIYELLHRELPEDPATEHGLAATYWQLAMIYAEREDQQQADVLFAKSSRIIIDLARRFPEKVEYRHNLCDALHIEAGIHFRKREFTAAEAKLQKAIDTCQALLAEDPEDEHLLGSLAWDHSLRGMLHLEARQNVEAAESYRRAWELSDALLRRHPDFLAYQSAAARFSIELADALRNLNRLPEAEEHYRSATQIRQQLFAQNPQIARLPLELALAHSRLGLVLAAQGRRDEAVAEFRCSIDGFAKCPPDAPFNEDFRYCWGVSCAHLFALLWEQGKRDEAIPCGLQAVQLRGQLSQASPSNLELERDNVTTCDEVAKALDDAGQFAESARVHRQWCDAQQRIIDREPGSLEERLKLARRLRVVAALETRVGNKAEAATAFGRALELSQSLQAQNSDHPDVVRELAYTLRYNAWFRCNADEPALAMPHCDAAIALLEPLRAQGLANGQDLFELVLTYQLLAYAQSAQGEQVLAEAALHKAIEVAEQLHQDAPDAVIPLASSHALLAGLFAFKGHGDPAVALESAEAAVRLVRLGYPLAITRAAVYYRLARYADSEKEIRRARSMLEIALTRADNASLHSSARQYRTLAQLLLAMNHFQLGRPDEARKSLATATDWCQAAAAIPLPAVRDNSEIEPALVARIRQEADALILGQPGEPTVSSLPNVPVDE